MNITFNSILESFHSIELPELSEDTAWYSAIGATLLLGAGLVYNIYKRSIATHPQNNPHHALTVISSAYPAYNLLRIRVSGNRDTLPETLKKQLLEQIQNWAGPQGYRFYPRKGIQVLPRSLNNLTVLANGSTVAQRTYPFPTIRGDFYLDHLNPQDIHGLLMAELNHPLQTYDFAILADDNSPPQMLDGILQDILNVFRINSTQ